MTQDELWKLSDWQFHLQLHYFDCIKTKKDKVSYHLAAQYTRQATFPEPVVHGVWKADEVKTWARTWFARRMG